MARPKKDPADTEPMQLLNFRYPEAQVEDFSVELLRAKLSRQTLCRALVDEWRAGRIVVSPAGEVSYPAAEPDS